MSFATYRQLEAFTALSAMEIDGLSMRVVCHQPHGMNSKSPASSTQVCAFASANRGKRTRSGFSTSFTWATCFRRGVGYTSGV